MESVSLEGFRLAIYNTILCLGDSLTFGARDEYHRGYPAELGKFLYEKSPEQVWITINEGVNGETSTDTLKRTPRVISLYSNAYVVLLQIGTNDTLELIPKQIFKDTVFQTIKICQSFHPLLGNRKVILGSLISLEGLGLFSYSKEGAKLLLEYNEILKELSIELKIPLIDLTSLEKFRIDKCHLNNEGYKEMAKLFLKGVMEL